MLINFMSLSNEKKIKNLIAKTYLLFSVRAYIKREMNEIPEIFPVSRTF